MDELTLLLLRLGFLALLWIFVFSIVYALRSDLFGNRARRDLEAGSAAPAPVAGPAPTPVPPQATVTERLAAQRRSPSTPPPPLSNGAPVRASRLVITGGPKEGLEVELPTEQLTIGRSSESGLVIRDDYTSTHHAKLMLWNDRWVIQDLDSTNGTFLDGQRVTVPVEVPLNTPVKIGTTSFELRR
ncbi:FHA domain-containing protein [Lysobacter korlensis]|uniref:FHA domain-containing protein n=1 Tax=Lysobacter korlensis TaxID=553636 RepID=A0ABV6RTM4_9GAMM